MSSFAACAIYETYLLFSPKMTVKQLVTALRTMERLNIFFGAEDYIGFCAGLKIGLSGSRYILAVIESNHTAEFFAPNQNYGDNYEEIATSILNYFNGAFTSASPNYIHFHTQQQQDTKQSKQPTQSIWDRLKERLQEGVRVGSSCLRWHLLIHKQKLYLVLFRKVLRQIEEVEDEDNEYWWDCEMIMDNLKIHNNFNRLNRNIENVTSNACNTALLNYFNDEQDEIFYSILMECPWIRKQIQIQRSTYHCYTQFVNLVQPMIDQNWAYQRGYNNNNRSKLRLQQFPSPNQIIFKLPIPSNTNNTTNTTPYSPSYSSSNQSQSSYSSFNSSPSIDAYSSYKQQQSNVQQTALIMTSITSASSSQVPDGKKPEQMKAIKEALRFIQQTEVFRELNKNRIGMYSQIGIRIKNKKKQRMKLNKDNLTDKLNSDEKEEINQINNKEEMNINPSVHILSPSERYSSQGMKNHQQLQINNKQQSQYQLQINNKQISQQQLQINNKQLFQQQININEQQSLQQKNDSIQSTNYKYNQFPLSQNYCSNSNSSQIHQYFDPVISKESNKQTDYNHEINNLNNNNQQERLSEQLIHQFNYDQQLNDQKLYNQTDISSGFQLHFDVIDYQQEDKQNKTMKINTNQDNDCSDADNNNQQDALSIENKEQYMGSERSFAQMLDLISPSYIKRYAPVIISNEDEDEDDQNQDEIDGIDETMNDCQLNEQQNINILQSNEKQNVLSNFDNIKQQQPNNTYINQSNQYNDLNFELNGYNTNNIYNQFPLQKQIHSSEKPQTQQILNQLELDIYSQLQQNNQSAIPLPQQIHSNNYYPLLGTSVQNGPLINTFNSQSQINQEQPPLDVDALNRGIFQTKSIKLSQFIEQTNSNEQIINLQQQNSSLQPGSNQIHLYNQINSISSQYSNSNLKPKQTNLNPHSAVFIPHCSPKQEQQQLQQQIQSIQNPFLQKEHFQTQNLDSINNSKLIDNQILITNTDLKQINQYNINQQNEMNQFQPIQSSIVPKIDIQINNNINLNSQFDPLNQSYFQTYSQDESPFQQLQPQNQSLISSSNFSNNFYSPSSNIQSLDNSFISSFVDTDQYPNIQAHLNNNENMNVMTNSQLSSPLVTQSNIQTIKENNEDNSSSSIIGIMNDINNQDKEQPSDHMMIQSPIQISPYTIDDDLMSELKNYSNFQQDLDLTISSPFISSYPNLNSLDIDTSFSPILPFTNEKNEIIPINVPINNNQNVDHQITDNNEMKIKEKTHFHRHKHIMHNHHTKQHNKPKNKIISSNNKDKDKINIDNMDNEYNLFISNSQMFSSQPDIMNNFLNPTYQSHGLQIETRF